eukprot:c29657_g1_i1 orf=194-883(-)
MSVKLLILRRRALSSTQRAFLPSALQLDSGMQRLVKGNRFLLQLSSFNFSRSLSDVASGRDGYSEDHLLKEEADHKDCIGGEEPDEAVDAGRGMKMSGATPQGIYKAILLGEASYSPSQKILRNGSTVTLFSLGTSGMRNNRKPFENETPDQYARRSLVQWHRIAIYQFRLGALAMKFVKKGSQVYVEGNMETRVFLDPESNTIKRIQEIAVRQNGRVMFLDQNKQKLS